MSDELLQAVTDLDREGTGVLCEVSGDYLTLRARVPEKTRQEAREREKPKIIALEVNPNAGSAWRPPTVRHWDWFIMFGGRRVPEICDWDMKTVPIAFRSPYEAWRWFECTYGA